MNKELKQLHKECLKKSQFCGECITNTYDVNLWGTCSQNHFKDFYVEASKQGYKCYEGKDVDNFSLTSKNVI